MEEIRIPSHVTTTFFNESAVLLDLRKNVYYALNDSAAEWWRLFMQIGSYEGALKELLKLYEDSPDAIGNDMKELFHSLVQAGLVEKVK